MKIPLLLLAISIGSIFTLCAESVIAPGAKLENLAGSFAFTEGPTCDKDGNVFFTDQPNNRIMEWSVDGKLSEFMKPAGRANGMYFDAKGNLIACAEEHNELWSIAPDKTVTVLAKNLKGKAFNAPNDVFVTPNGGMYFTDPLYRRTWTDTNYAKISGEFVFYVSPDGKVVKPVIEDFKKPNGISGTPDGKTLFVADIGANKTYSYDIQPDGSLTNKTPMCESGSDGMTIDAEGNFYLTNRKSVIIFDKSGKEIERIAVPGENWTANVCFGGKDRQTLFITASKSLYSIQMRVKGANPAK
jgi:gluconolactonase